jgi:hypothetical protein
MKRSPILKYEKGHKRIVIIGNGFDRALGLKSSYKNFIDNYIRDVFIKVYKNCIKYNKIESTLITVSISVGNAALLNNDYNLESVEDKNTTDLLKILKTYGDISYVFKFFEKIVGFLNVENWVDVEQYYFENLKDLYKRYEEDFDSKKTVLAGIKELNDCMDVITIELKEYILNQQNSISINNSPMIKLIDKCRLSLKNEVLDILPRHEKLGDPQHIIFVNFNYTNTLLNILERSSVRDISKHIYIHGNAKDNSNPIIFGYGDDTSELYNNLESLGQNEFLKKIKSFQYPRTHNYHKLLSIIENDKYEVFIIGHSCGLSDRTLLKTIFENNNCLAIQNFHYRGEDEDFYKRMDISRHFSDKIKMRERVLPFDPEAKIPQEN